MEIQRDSGAGHPDHKGHGTIWPLWFLMAIGLSITAGATWVARTVAQNEAEKDFFSSCNDVRATIIYRLAEHARILRGGAALFDATDRVTRKDWHTFVQRQKIEQQLPGIQGFGFALLIPREQLASHTQEIRREGFPNYLVKPEGDREIYSSIIYLEPFSGRNLRAFGYDMFSEPVRRAAMERARDTDAPALSGKVVLVQENETDVQAGTLMYTPVYQKGMPIETVEQRRACLYGWVYSPYRMTDLLKSIQGPGNLATYKFHRLQIFDDEQTAISSLLFDSQPTMMNSVSIFTRSLPVDFAGHRWTLLFSKADGMADANYHAGLLFASGSIITLLLFGLSQSVLANRFKDGQMAEQNAFSLSLRHAHDELENQVAKRTQELQQIVETLRVSENRLTVIRKELQAKNEELETILDNMPGLVFYKDTKNNFVKVNKYLANVQKTSKEAFQGKNLAELYSKAEADKYYSDDLAVFREGKPRLNIEEIWETASGQAWVSTSKIPIYDENNNPKGILGLSFDITEKKKLEILAREREERYHLLFDESPDAYLIMAFDRGQILACNQATERMLHGKREQILGMTPDQVSPCFQPDGRLSSEAAADRIAESLKSGSHRFEWLHRTLDGINFWAEETISVITMDGQKALLVAWRNITDRKRVEKELEKKSSELAESNAELEQFAYVASHDLRAPLCAIESLSEWLEQDLGGSLQGESAKHLQLLRNRAKRMEKLLDDLLEYARIGHGEATVGEIDAAALVKELVDFQGLKNRFDLKLRNLPVFTTIYTAFRQVLHNLISNVAKHHDKGNGVISVTALERDGFYEFSFADDGPGIPKEYQDKVFGMFQTLKPRDEVEGSGMGLAMVKKIIEHLGGNISLGAAQPRGLEVRFTWPIHMKKESGIDAG
ncbi:MAG: CHASE domain-containing protein [Candidatus Ozemobacteraceae bacterium]